MAAERDLSKKELKHIFRNPVEVTEAMYWKMIDTLWRDKYTMRTSGFVHAGSPDSVIAFDAVTRIFSITPRDPEVETYKPRFSFYTYNYTAHYEQRYKPEFLELPDVEGLYVIYYDTDEYHRTHKLFSLRNPDEYQLRDIYYDKVIVAFIYWDAVAKQALHFGDSRHGSEWQPQMHLYLHTAFNARRKNGLTLTGTNFGGDGSSNEHAQFSVTGGTMLHDDFEMDIPSSSNSLPILYQYGTLPRYHTKTGYAIYQLSSRACYNSGGAVIPADEGFHVLYHIFATNEIGIANRKIISVMGRWHYETLAEAYAAAPGELDYALSWMPQQGRLHIATIVVQTSDAYTNDIHSRIVGIWGEGHPPVTIAENTKQLLEITDKQELSIPGNFETDEFYAIKNRVWQKIVSGGGGADGRGIVSILLTSTAGLVKTYTITYTDATTSTFDVTDGEDGAPGRGISSIALHATVGLVKTYRITFTDATTFDYDVTDGEEGGGGTGGTEPPELHLDFEEAGDEFTYTVPYAMKFTSQVSLVSDATLDVALNTNLARYDKLTVTATAGGLVSLYGEYL